VRLVVEPGDSFLDPTVECFVDQSACGLQIVGNSLDVPALGVQSNDRKPTFSRVVELVVARISSSDP